MKIAFLSFYSGEVNRGVETHVHCLANALVKLGIEVTVYQNGPKRNHSNYYTEVIGLPINWDKPPEGIRFNNYWSKLIKSFTIQVLKKIDSETDIIIPTNGEWQYLLTKWWCLKHNKKMVIAGHSGVGLDERIGLLMFPDCFIAFTDYQLYKSRGRNPFIRVEKIPNGVNLTDFVYANPLKVNLSEPVVMTSSALIPSKRIDLIINAVSKTKASLLIVGNGIEREYLQKLGEKLLPNKFKIIELPYSKMPQAYKAADLFVFATSTWESFGIVLVEAMAANLPIVAVDDPIRREIVGEAGVFVNPTDTNAFSAAIDKALKTSWEDKPLKQAEKYDWSKIAVSYQQLFLSLLK